MFDSTGSMLANLERIKYDQFIVILIVFYALYKLLTVDANGKKKNLFLILKKKNIKYKRPNMAEPETNIFLFSSLWMNDQVDSVLLHSFMLLPLFLAGFAACWFMLSRIQTSEPN